MHEFTIATNIIEIAEESAKNANAEKITDIVIEVGTYSGVIIEALETALSFAKMGTLLEHAHTSIHEIKAQAQCTECKTVFSPDDFFTPCPNCGSFQLEIIRGKDLKVKSISVE